MTLTGSECRGEKERERGSQGSESAGKRVVVRLCGGFYMTSNEGPSATTAESHPSMVSLS